MGGEIMGVVIVLIIFANAFCTGWLVARVRKRDKLLESMRVEVERANFERDIAWKHMTQTPKAADSEQYEAESV